MRGSPPGFTIPVTETIVGCVMSFSDKYVPKDLDDALDQLDRIMGEERRAEVLKIEEDGLLFNYMGLGAGLRKDWGLWAESRLAQYFNRVGIEHPDYMLAIILCSYWRKVHGKPIDLEGQVREYQRIQREDNAAGENWYE